MSTVTIMERFAEGHLLFDGGMGSMLIGLGLATGWPPEEWNVSRPEVIGDVHRAYLEAGADVIETNTFGSTPGRLKTHNLGNRIAELNTRGVRLAREAVAESTPATHHRFVALSMGPSGAMLPPVGTADRAQVGAEFTEQIDALGEGELPDLVLIETMIDLREAVIALETVRSMIDVPVAVSMTYNRNPRGFFTVMGDEATATTKHLEAAGVDVIAANCSITSHDMLDLAKLLRDTTTLPVLCQPNAGNPTLRNGVPVYDQAPQEFAEHALDMLSAGINAVGGCCGTTPDFIRCVSDAIGPREGERLA